jgi:glycosyltransferase involved in cell wall biosynthesis
MSTLSVCIIAKNESEVIGRCLDCVKSFADEIVVVDTGSTDNTKEIASKYTDKVFDFEWIDDFAAARNFSFSKATKDYVMWLDCDDIIDEDNQRAILGCKQTLSTLGCDTFLARYYIGQSTTTTVTRIIKRGSCQWVGFVHEYLASTTRRYTLDFTIRHGKPASSVERDSGRNLRIFMKKMAENVEFSTRDILYFAKELYWNGKYRPALRWFNKFLNQSDAWIEDCIEASRMKADIIGHIGKAEDMIDFLARSIVKYGMNTRLLYNCGLALYNAKKYKEATMYFLAIVNGLGINSQYFIDTTDYTFLSLIWLSCCYWYSGDKLTGKRFHELAKAIRPNSPTIQTNEKFFGGV